LCSKKSKKERQLEEKIRLHCKEEYMKHYENTVSLNIELAEEIARIMVNNLGEKRL